MTEPRRVAVVTGAGKGIGKHVARQLAQAGLLVYVGAQDAEGGQECVDELASEGLDVRLVVFDVTDPTAIAAAAARVEDEQGHLDVLVNNAGISTGFAPPTETSLGDFRTTFETNLFGAIATTNAFISLLRRAPAARVVNVSSHVGSLEYAAGESTPGAAVNAAAYRASKAALNMVTVCYAKEFRDTPMKFNAINPGNRQTDLAGKGVVIPGAGHPAGGAEIVVKMALVGPEGPTGGFFNYDDSIHPW